MNKVKVLQVSNYFPPHVGGIETVCYDICQFLKKYYDVQVICFGNDEKTLDEEVDGVLVHRVGYQRKIASQALAKDYGKILDKVIKEFNPDVIHFHYPNPFVAHYLLKAMKKNDFKGKFILHWHADIIKQKILKKFFVGQNKRLLNRADLILATSPSYLKDTDYLPYYIDKTKVLPLCVGRQREVITEEEKNKANQIKERYSNKKIGFFFGRHVPYKGLTYLIEADRHLNRDEIEIIIAGQGPLTDSLKEQAKEFKNIHFVGRLSEEDINSYLLASDIFFFPSITRNEAFGISLAEAMYFGKPAATFTIKGSGVNYVCPDRECGMEAKNSDAKDYACKIEEILKDENYERLSKNAFDRAHELFSRDSFEKNIVDIYDTLMKRN